ncbi:MAG: adenylate kinase [Candidatus Binatia bacterium]
MRLVLLGPPGAGKGTQAKLLEERLGVPQISTGDILRRGAQDGSALGRKAREYMDQGELVPDELMIGIVEEQLTGERCGRGFLLDGFPRTVAQAEALETMLARRKFPLEGAVSLRVPFDQVVERLSGRRTCSDCGAMFHLVFDKPKDPKVCDRCGGRLYQRKDDKEETIRARLDVYERATAPLRDFYRGKKQLLEVDGTGSPTDVLARVLAKLPADWMQEKVS